MTEGGIEFKARSVARRIALRIALACGIAMLCVFAVGMLYLLYRSNRPVHDDESRSGSFMIRLDPADLAAGMIILALTGILLAAAVGWLSARSAIRPLEESLARQRRFVQDASHELRTPLAILDARVQLAQRQLDDAHRLDGTLTKIRQDTRALTGIVEELLLAATAAEVVQQAIPLEATAPLKRLVEDLKAVAEQQRIGLELRAEEPLHLRLAESSLRRVVLALADNAIAHTPQGGKIRIVAVADGKQAVITVHDTGSGMSELDRERIFDRFVRAGDPGRSSRGFGIGLALVREIVEAAGGDVAVADSGPAGTTMRVRLPLAEPVG